MNERFISNIITGHYICILLFVQKRESILVVTVNRVSRFSLVPPLNSVSEDWSYLRSLWKPGDPLPPCKTCSPLPPSFQAKNGDLFLTSAQRFSENIKFMISYLSIFLIWDWRMLWILQILPKSKAIKWSCKKKTPFGIRPMWSVMFLSLILSLFQMIILPSSDVDKRGWDSAHPAFSCKEILDSGNSKGDGEYWINPEKSGNPLRVYCDRSRYGGKWISLFIWDTRNLIGVYLTWSSFY